MNNTIAISDARAIFPNLIARAYENLERFLITVNGKPKAAVMSIDELESLEETAEILSIPGAKENIKKGLKELKKGKFIPLSKL